MHIKEFNIDSFGIFTDQRAPSLLSGLNIFYGDNEAGKSTCINFFRGIFFGYKRGTKNSPLFFNKKAALAGGSLDINTKSGQAIRLVRRPGAHGGTPVITGSNGEPLPESFWQSLLHGCNGELYDNCFAFGLSDLQNMLTGSGSNQMRGSLYDTVFGPGLGSLKDFTADMQNRMDAVYRPKGVVYPLNRCLAELHDLKRAAREQGSELEDYQTLRQAEENVEAELTALYGQEEHSGGIEGTGLAGLAPTQGLLAGLQAERRSLEQRLHIWRYLRQMHQCEAMLKLHLPVAGSFTPGAQERLERLVEQRADRQAELSSRLAELRQQEEALQALVPQPKLLCLKQPVQRLTERRDTYAGAVREMPLVRQKLQGLERGVAAALAGLGPDWSVERVLAFDRSLAAREELAAYGQALSQASLIQDRAEREYERCAGEHAGGLAELERLFGGWPPKVSRHDAAFTSVAPQGALNTEPGSAEALHWEEWEEHLQQMRLADEQLRQAGEAAQAGALAFAQAEESLRQAESALQQGKVSVLQDLSALGQAGRLPETLGGYAPEDLALLEKPEFWQEGRTALRRLREVRSGLSAAKEDAAYTLSTRDNLQIEPAKNIVLPLVIWVLILGAGLWGWLKRDVFSAILASNFFLRYSALIIVISILALSVLGGGAYRLRQKRRLARQKLVAEGLALKHNLEERLAALGARQAQLQAEQENCMAFLYALPGFVPGLAALAPANDQVEVKNITAPYGALLEEALNLLSYRAGALARFSAAQEAASKAADQTERAEAEAQKKLSGAEEVLRSAHEGWMDFLQVKGLRVDLSPAEALSLPRCYERQALLAQRRQEGARKLAEAGAQLREAVALRENWLLQRGLRADLSEDVIHNAFATIDSICQLYLQQQDQRMELQARLQTAADFTQEMQALLHEAGWEEQGALFAADKADPFTLLDTLRERVEQVVQQEALRENKERGLETVRRQAQECSDRLAETEGLLQEMLRLGQAGEAEEYRRKFSDWKDRMELLRRRGELAVHMEQVLHPIGSPEAGDYSAAPASLEAEPEYSPTLRSMLEALSALELSSQDTEAALLNAQTTLEAKMQESEARGRILLTQRGNIRSDLDALLKRHGGRSAPDLRQQMRDKQEEAQALAGRWIVPALAKYFVEKAKKRFSEERETTLMRETSQLFSLITGGEYSGVSFNLDDGKILAMPRHGEPKDAESALSQGTRDQLYLALRFAYLRQYAMQGEPLPLIMDDILAHFDAGRARHAALALAELSRENQILFFTCHAHTEALFRAVAPESAFYRLQKGQIVRA